MSEEVCEWQTASRVRHYKRVREPVNSITHSVGIVFAVAALVLLVYLAVDTGNARLIVGFAIFGASLIAMYTASTLYHTLPLSPAGITRLRRIDHMMVFVLIAGTYTPIALVGLHGAWRWLVLGLVWGLASWGVVLKVCRPPTCRGTSGKLYVLMALVSLIAAPPLLRVLPVGAILWVVAGGAVYALGTIVLAHNWPRLRPGVFEGHELWHFFVLGGSVCHFWVMLRYIVPLGA